ncbi:hypothetical protein [Nocardioides sp. GCM10030258]|uniref:hypothetical protein n=1 Tax=unclassified Nocardioides TaxID=2615069 RepID=UPI0036075574
MIIAMFIITVVALVTGAVLTRGDGSLRATVALRDVARSSYTADAAAQVAINDLRTGYNIGTGEPSPWYYTNELGTGCFGYNGSGPTSIPMTTLTLDNLVPQQSNETQDTMSAAVVCGPEDATGAQGTAVPINNSNKPGNAILTLGTSATENGFTFKTNGSAGAFRVRGGIWSHSNILRDNNGTLESTESIRARTGCSPMSAMSAPTVNCFSGTAPADPNYANELSATGRTIADLELQIPPTTCPGNSVTLQPGIYDDATKLNALTPNGGGNCFIHFQPGAYYFDFHNSSGDPLFDSDIVPSAGNVWAINSGTIVGGALTTDNTVPGRCVNPIDDVNADGVQFIFGGDSRMVVDKGAVMELCATYHSTRPPIVIYGQKTGTASSTTLSGVTALTSTAVTIPGSFLQATAANVQAADGNQATNANLAYWQRDSTGANSAQPGTMTMTGFAPGTNLPKGTVLTGARLKVTHRSTGNANAFTLTPNLGTGPISYTMPARGTLGTEDVDLSARTGWGAFQKAVHDSGFSGASFKFDASLGRNQISQLDAVRLELTYYVPQIRAQSGSVTTPGGLPVVQALGNSTFFYAQGTTYVPLAKIDLALNNINESVFRFGVIARALDVFETASFGYTGAVIELPDNSPGFGFETTLVRLEVYVCPGATCTVATGKLALKARVKVFDDGAVPGPPHRQVTILNWSHTR